jgi:hypothetical protein
MAAKKAKKKTSKAVVSMDALRKRMAVHASADKARINQPVGVNIGIRNGKFTYRKNVIGREFRGIVLDFVHTNAFYTEKFDPDNPTPPGCFAMSADGEDMKPESVSPKKQSDYCNGCPQNAWGSADIGDGKACKNQYRLAVIAPKKDEDPSESEIAILTLPPTSLKNWDKYVSDLEDAHHLATYGVVTCFTFDEAEEWPVLIPELDSVIKSAGLLSACADRTEVARTMLMEPFDVSSYERAKKKKVTRKKKTAKKKTAGKKRAKKKSKYSA